MFSRPMKIISCLFCLLPLSISIAQVPDVFNGATTDRVLRVEPGAPEGGVSETYGSIGAAIQAARQMLELGESVTVQIPAGVYREDIVYALNFKPQDSELIKETLLIL